MLVEKKAAKDTLDNFIQQWRKQALECENLLIRLTDEEFNLDWECKDMKNSWNVQYLSI